ncbi:unnamed protein product [Brassica oleracea var. botrytis]
MFVKRPWKWTMDCGEVTGTWVNTKPAVVSPAKKKVVKEDSPRPQKKACKEAPAEASEEAPAEASEEAPAEASEEVHTVARSDVTTTVGGLTKEDIKTMFKDIVDAMREEFGTCLKEIKYLSKGWKLWKRRLVSPQNRKGHHLKTLPLHLNRRSNPGVKVLMGRTREGRACRRIKVQMCPHMLVVRKIKLQNRALRMLDIRKRGMLLWHFTVQRVIEQGNLLPHNNLLLYPGYNPFAPIDKKKLKELADWLKTCPHYRTPLDKKPRTSRTWWYHILRTSLEWLEDCVIIRLISSDLYPILYASY